MIKKTITNVTHVLNICVKFKPRSFQGFNGMNNSLEFWSCFQSYPLIVFIVGFYVEEHFKKNAHFSLKLKDIKILLLPQIWHQKWDRFFGEWGLDYS